MPIHPGMVEPLAERTRDLYAEAERRLLRIIARQLAAGLDAPTWAEQKLAAVQQLRRSAQAVVDELGKATSLEVFDVVAEAYNVGRGAAVAEIGALSDDGRRLVDERTPNAQAVDRLAVETVDRVTSTHRSILRAVLDAFRRIVSEVTATPLLGAGSRRQAAQDAMRRFADEGIRSFVDRAGRRWQLTSYAEMAVRTSVARAATEAHMRTLSDAGIDLVYVSDAPRECPLCRPWEGRVLSIGGEEGPRTVRVEHATEDGRIVPVRVAGSLDEARRAGLQHPNCRHSVSAYTPGLTRIEQAESDPDGYEAGQRQREIERRIRKYKRRQAAAITPEAKKAAGKKVRQWQGRMRDHLAAHPDLRRNRTREQEGAGNLPPEQRTHPRGQHAPQHTAPTAEDVEAARIRSGDEQTPREMSDDQLAGAAASPAANRDDLARIEAEGDRRDRAEQAERIRPGGTLAADLTPFTDDQLADAMRDGTADELARIAAEFDRRYPPEPAPAPATTGDAVADLLADRAAVDDLLAPAPDPDGWAALADDEEWAEAVGTAATVAGDDEHQEQRLTRREARALYDEYVYRQYLAAEDDLRGYLLNKKAQTDGIDPVSLFRGPARIAHARASDELRAWWAQHGRLTQAEFIESVTGQHQRWAEGARKNEADHQNKR